MKEGKMRWKLLWGFGLNMETTLGLGFSLEFIRTSCSSLVLSHERFTSFFPSDEGWFFFVLGFPCFQLAACSLDFLT